jgi:Acetyltransferase (GNAT) domain
MNLAVRRASLIDDREEIIDLLNRNFEEGQEKRFDWRHLSHPAGPAWCWFVYDRDSHKTIATAAVFPRQMFVDGKLVVCGQVGGFAVEATHRSLGPAVLMQRTTFEPADSGALAFCYDTPPHDRGMSTFVRLGIQPSCEVTRFALLLRSDEYLQNRLGNGTWTRAAIAAGNLVLRTKPFHRTAPSIPGLEISGFERRFDEEFTFLDSNFSTSGMVRASRSAENLNWCYRDNPGSDFRVLVARRSGELLGYVVYLVYRNRVAILDVFGREISQIGRALIDALAEISRKEKRVLLEAFCSDQSELKSLFMDSGFQAREKAARVVAYEKPQAGIAQLLGPRLRWEFNGFELLV